MITTSEQLPAETDSSHPGADGPGVDRGRGRPQWNPRILAKRTLVLINICGPTAPTERAKKKSKKLLFSLANGPASELNMHETTEPICFTNMNTAHISHFTQRTLQFYIHNARSASKNTNTCLTF